MLKKTISYEDLDGNVVTEDFYFNFTKAELAEFQLTTEGGFTDHLRKIIASQDGKDIIATFKMLLGQAVGQRSEDGKRFLKSKEITDDFMMSPAYSELFMELVTDAEAAAEFIRNVVPSDIGKNVTSTVDLGMLDSKISKPIVHVEGLKKVADYTREELLDMPQDRFDAVVGTDPQQMTKDVLVIAMQRATRK